MDEAKPIARNSASTAEGPYELNNVLASSTVARVRTQIISADWRTVVVEVTSLDCFHELRSHVQIAEVEDARLSVAGLGVLCRGRRFHFCEFGALAAGQCGQEEGG